MNTLLSKKLSAIIISGLFLGAALSNDLYAQSLDTSSPENAHTKLGDNENSHDHGSEKHDTEEEHHEGEHSDDSSEKHDEHNHGNENKNEISEEEHEEGITLSPQKMSIANIQVTSIKPEYQSSTIYAPGEVKANGYKSYVVSPRTESVIINRHATLGEHVEKGQKLVTLFSEAVAQAQADYLIASTEWQRIKKLGNKTVSGSRLLQAQTGFNASYGKLIALGLTKQAIGDISNKDVTAFGQYTLIAHREGVVLQDDFILGQGVNAGDTIMLLADEKQLWVEAKVSPNKKLHLSINSPALVVFNGDNYQAKVIQEAHTIDPTTRTRIIRLTVNNDNHDLHSGMFVKVLFQFETQHKVIAVPEEALIRSSDGDWTVYVEDHPGEFKAVEVELGRSLGEFREIIGLENGTRVVTQGAFFVASEIAKGGFDPHNH